MVKIKKGTEREDGYVFWSMHKGRERWYKKDVFEREMAKTKVINKASKCGSVRKAGGMASRLLYHAKSRAKTECASVTITQDWIKTRVQQLLDQGLVSRSANHPLAPSLDKIDPSIRDYTPENTRVVPVCVNYAKHDWSDEQVKSTIIPALLKIYFPEHSLVPTPQTWPSS